MVNTTWTQTAGMTSDTDTDNIEDYVDQAEASKDAAAASEAAAAGSATAAAGSATTATTKASESQSSATASATSASDSQVSRVASEAAKVASETAQTAAETARDAAAASSTSASSSQAAAATSAATAATEASNSATSASASEASNVAAGVAKVAAETAETAAQTAQAAAEAAEAATEALFDQFGDQYLGPKASDPTVDNDGNPLAEGAVYFNTANDVLKFYSGSAWVAPESVASTAAAAAQAAQAAAETAKANAETAEVNAETAEANAASSAGASANSASASATSEANSNTSEANALTYSSNAATSAAQAASSAAGIAGYDLDVIAETKGVTAVDVFVYDTSKDSDGGAWRKRTQGTSWYNETLNTATRGSRREFPAVAVIVAEGNTVTIYDGDDPSLPMWMVFEGNTTHVNGKLLQADASGGRPVSSVMMLNGLFSFTVYSNWLSYGQVNFISEDVKLDYLSGQRFTVATRNDPLTQNIGGDFAKSFTEGNDVAMTVLPNAPIDAATGLAVPTIAVATGGGTSIIRDDGTVVDITGILSGSRASDHAVLFDDVNRLWLVDRDFGDYGFYLVGFNSVPSADTTVSSADFKYSSTSSSAVFGNIRTLGTTSNLAISASAGSSGLTKYSHGIDANDGMVAYQTSTHNTGWMNGDIKGAFLSDTDTANLVGSGELISNGGFDEDTFGWTASGQNALITWDEAGYLVLRRNGTSAVASQTIPTVSGETYVISFDLVATSGSAELGVSFGSTQSSRESSAGTYTFTATASSASTVVSLNTYNTSVGSLTIDNISVKLADADHSVNNNGLVVSSKTYDPWHDDLNLSFDDESFTVDREASDFMSAITHDASSNATMTGGYGPELVTAQDYSSGWTAGGAWTISGGEALVSGVGDLTSEVTIPSAGAYTFKFRVKSISSGSIGVSYVPGSGTATISDAGTFASTSVPGFIERTFVFSSGGTFSVKVFSGDAGNIATVVDPSVREIPKVQWRPHNLLPYSEDFTQWSTYGTITVTADDTTAPDGTTTADKVAFGSSANDSIWKGSTPNAGYTVTFAVWAKAASATTARLRIWDTDTGSQYSSDLSIGTSWTLLTHTATIGSASTTSNFTIYNNSTGTTSDIHIWGAHLYRSDLGGMAPVPTDLQTAGSTTYVRTAGREVTGTELVTNGTFDSDTSGWTAIHGVISHQSGKIRVEEDGVNASGPRAYQIINTEVGKVYRAEADASNFNIASNAVLVASTNTNTGGFPTAVFSSGTGRLEFVATTTQTYLLVTANSSVTGAYVDFDNISVKEIDVDPSTARYLPRLGHHVYNGSAWVNEGLLHESEARTNLVTYSEDFSQWTPVGLTITSNALSDPAGGTSATKITENSFDMNHNMDLFTATISPGAVTGSMFLKKGERQYARLRLHETLYGLRAWFDLENGVVTAEDRAGSASITDVGNGWYRCSVTDGSNTSSSSSACVQVFTQSTSGAQTTYLGDGASGIYIWGAQLEQAPTPSSYIPTSGTTATRAAETLTIPAANLPYNSTAMTIQMDGRMTYADEGAYSTSIGVSWRKDADNFIITMDCSTNSADTGRVFFSQEANSVYDAVSEPGPGSYSPDILVPFNIASRHGSTFINGAVDGVAVTANTTPTALPDLSATDLSLGYDYMGTVRNFRMWGNDIKDDGIEIVTQPSIVPSLSLSFDGSEASHVEFDWSEK